MKACSLCDRPRIIRKPDLCLKHALEESLKLEQRNGLRLVVNNSSSKPMEVVQ